MRTLTPRQRDVVACIRRYVDAHGYPPATAEIARDLSITGNAVYGHLTAIERKGFLLRAAGIARGIRLLDPPGSGSREGHHRTGRLEIDS